MDRPSVAARSVTGYRSLEESAEKHNSTIGINNSLLLLPCQFSDLIEISNVDRDRNIGRVPVVQKVLQPNFHRNRRNHLTEPGYLQVLHLPDLDHERAEFFADKTHLALAKIDPIEMVLRQHVSHRVRGGRKRVGKMEKIGQIPP